MRGSAGNFHRLSQANANGQISPDIAGMVATMTEDELGGVSERTSHNTLLSAVAFLAKVEGNWRFSWM
jgi:hypothetical protein